VSQVSEDAVRTALATVREQLTEEITEAIEKAVREEREATVAYLSEFAAGGDTFGPRGSGDHLRLIATNIQRGWHRREEEE
jgi:GGDEF domain-containing protein